MAGSDSKPLATSSSACSRTCSSPPPTTSSKDSQGPKRHRRILDHLPTGSDQDPSVSPKNASNGVSRDGRAATGEGVKRSEERRGGEEGGSMCRSRWSPSH